MATATPTWTTTTTAQTPAPAAEVSPASSQQPAESAIILHGGFAFPKHRWAGSVQIENPNFSVLAFQAQRIAYA